MNIKTLFLVCLALTFINIKNVHCQAKDKVSKVVIDAGHGGEKPGAVGKLCKEKTLNLAVSLKLGKLISQNFDDVTVIYTRKTDENVELFKRAEIANKNKADLFISIHCNASPNKQARGIETFVMGLGKSEESMEIAKKENADMLLEKDYQSNYSGFDPNSPEAYIVFSLYASAYLKNSALFASKVQSHLVNNSKMTDRSVQQAGFWVLYKVAMPSILVELGFISNVEEEKYLISDEAHELLAVSIYNAFVEYKNLIEGTEKALLPIQKVVKTHPTITQNDQKQFENQATNDSEAISDSIQIPKTTNKNEVSFRVQFFSCKENISASDKRFSGIKDVKKYNENNFWKFTSGNAQTLDAAQVILKNVKTKFADAFIVAFNNEIKITIPEAKELMNND